MSDFHILEQALAMHDPGDLVTIDDLREPLVIAQIPTSRWGILFRQAIAHGLITTDGGTIKSRHPTSRGRRVLVYKIAQHRHDRPRNVHPAAAA